MRTDWNAEFPSLQLPQPIDLMSLLEADVGPIYKRIQEGDPAQKTYGYIPRMAHGVVGALNSEGFCERMLSRRWPGPDRGQHPAQG